MGFNSLLFLSLFLPQFMIIFFFNKKNIQNTGKNKGSYNTANAIQGLIFALLTTIVSPLILTSEYSLGGNNTVATDIMIHIALSFFTCHIIFIILAKNITSEITHHVICMGALLYSLVTQTFGQDLILTIFLGEITFTHYAKIVAKNMNWNTLEHQLNEIFFFSFSFIRLFIFPVYLYTFITYASAPILLKLFAVAFVGLGIYYNNIIAKNRASSQKKKMSLN
ncbi:hypothetical protein [Aureispira sp. CCB-E]|uniref:hypothetical protein n=1 Tax=Aureispira sp. CCB-E TaxID=3051121 RepID=UPI002868F663|nr:hypothetical protein [Aureispira sp. CCB-E]WMX15505.1 hypothetical protein QP953_03830 [Aureispira sp. CCB-E]